MANDGDDLPFTERERQSAPDRSSTTGGNFNGSAPQINGISATEEFVINNQDAIAHTFTFTPRGSANDGSTFTESIPAGVACKYSGRGISKVSIDSTTASATWKRGPRGTVFPLSNPSGAGGAGTVATSSDANFTPSSTSANLMAGFGSTLKLTPKKSGIVRVVITMNWQSLGGSTGAVQVRYGTGSAPARNSAATGTAVGSLLTTAGFSSGAVVPITLDAVITGLTLGTAYWFDFTGSIAGATDVFYQIFGDVEELPY